MLSTDKAFFKPPEVAKLLRVDNYIVIQFIKSGELPAVDVSRTRRIRPRWRISKSDLEAFLERRATHPQPPDKRGRPKKQANDNIVEFYQ